MKSIRFQRAAVCLILALLITLTIPNFFVYAHGFIDQYNDPVPNISSGCGTPKTGNLYQSFTPGGRPPFLSGVDLRLRAGGLFPITGYTTTIRIRSGSPSGTVLAEASTFVSSPPIGGKIVHFEIGPPSIKIKPGTLYVIEWVSPPEGGTILTWMRTTEDTYSGGNGFWCNRNAAPNIDFNFITYKIPANSHVGGE
jgi:hypothetical protein